MTTKNPQTCLSAEQLRQLSHDELSPAELKDVEELKKEVDSMRTGLDFGDIWVEGMKSISEKFIFSHL